MGERLFSRFTVSARESALYEGPEGRQMESLARNVMADGTINTNHLEAAQALGTRFLQAGSMLLTKSESVDIREEGGLLVPNSTINLSGLNITPMPQRQGSKQHPHTANLFKVYASGNAVSLQSRPFPIIWNFGHIAERIQQRSKLQKEFESSYFMRLTALGLSMNRIFEERVDWKKTKFVPFALPAKSGLFLGAAHYNEDYLFGNRLGISMYRAVESESFGIYDWKPRVEMRVNTFIGLDEIKPNQTAVRSGLQSFMQPLQSDALALELDAYGYIEGKDTYDMDTRKDQYEAVFADLKTEMSSLTWMRGVRLSRGHQQANFDFAQFKL